MYNDLQLAFQKDDWLIPESEWVPLKVDLQLARGWNPGKRLPRISEEINGRYSVGRGNMASQCTACN